MSMKIKLTSVYVDDQDKALRFYTEVLGFVKKADFTQGSFRWLTVASPEDADGTELHYVDLRGVPDFVAVDEQSLWHDACQAERAETAARGEGVYAATATSIDVTVCSLLAADSPAAASVHRRRIPAVANN
jgi:catechol 2,3-dioxygenase-like lactoylglutathione lyase family enzyme